MKRRLKMRNNGKFRIEQWGKAVVFQVLEMNKNFMRKKFAQQNIFRASNGMEIKSAANPQLKLNEIFLRGNNEEKDNSVVSKLFSTREEAEKYIKQLKMALTEWSDWMNKNKKEQERPNDNIFIV